MAAQLVRITSDVEIPYLTYQGQPVLTFTLIDKVHSRPEGTAGRNFRANKERFIEKEDYFSLSQSDMEAIDEFRPSMNPKGILLITEPGYLMLVKSFTNSSPLCCARRCRFARSAPWPAGNPCNPP